MRNLLAGLLLLVAAGASAQEGFPLDGTWRGEHVAADGSHRHHRAHHAVGWQAGYRHHQSRVPRAPNSPGAELTPAGWKFTLAAKNAKGADISFDGRALEPRQVQPRARRQVDRGPASLMTSASCTNKSRHADQDRHCGILAIAALLLAGCSPAQAEASRPAPRRARWQDPARSRAGREGLLGHARGNQPRRRRRHGRVGCPRQTEEHRRCRESGAVPALGAGALQIPAAERSSSTTR